MDGGAGETPVTSFDDAAGQVIDLLDSLHIDEAVIGGVSMGGYLTFALFRHAARYFRGMVLADTRPQADTPEGKEGRTRMLALLAEKGPAAVADEMMPKLLAPETIRDQAGRRRAGPSAGAGQSAGSDCRRHHRADDQKRLDPAAGENRVSDLDHRR